MNPDQYRAAVARLGFSSTIDAGKWLGVNDRTARMFADPDGEGPPFSVAILLKLMMIYGIGPDEVDRKVDRWDEHSGLVRVASPIP